MINHGWSRDNKEALISIVMPAYNTDRYIRDAIESVIRQTWINWELIIVNDGSTDETKNICETYAAKDQRIVLINKKNEGVSSARNDGLKRAKGEFLAFLDSDDVYPVNSLKSRVTTLINTGADVVGGNVQLFDSDLKKVIKEFDSEYNGNFILPLSKMDEGVFLGIFYVARFSSIDGVFFREGLKNSEDLMFWLECCAKKKLQYIGIKEESYYYRFLESSSSNNLKNWAKYQKKVVMYVLGLDIKNIYKFNLISRIMRQLLSYHIKSFLGKKTKQFKEIG